MPGFPIKDAKEAATPAPVTPVINRDEAQTPTRLLQARGGIERGAPPCRLAAESRRQLSWMYISRLHYLKTVVGASETCERDGAEKWMLYKAVLFPP